MSHKVHLVDGTYELFRHYYGARNDETLAPNGMEVGGTHGLLRSFAFLLRDPEVTHVAVAFDHVIESFRNDLFAGYKTGEGIDPLLKAQFPLAERATEALGIVVWPMVEFEADDALAAGAARYREHPDVEQVVLASPDKDLTQCVRGTEVVAWDRMRRKIIDEDGVVAKFGVSPASIPDYLALVGDDADGIPGLAGWGAKSSAQLLAEYGHVDAIPDDAAAWTVKVRGAARLAETLAANREAVTLYRTLATLRTDVPLDEEVDDLLWDGVDERALEDLEDEIGPSGLRLPDPPVPF